MVKLAELTARQVSYQVCENLAAEEAIGQGFPESSPNTQARHWFSGAIFDLILYHGENPDVSLALGLPGGFPTYKGLAPRVKWLQESMPFRIYWVADLERLVLGRLPFIRTGWCQALNFFNLLRYCND